MTNTRYDCSAFPQRQQSNIISLKSPQTWKQLHKTKNNHLIYTTLQAINHYKYTQNTRHQELSTHFIKQIQYKTIYKTLVIKDILYKSCNCIFYAYQY